MNAFVAAYTARFGRASGIVAVKESVEATAMIAPSFRATMPWQGGPGQPDAEP